MAVGFINYPIVRLSVCFTCGILCSRFELFPPIWILGFTGIVILLLGLFWIVSRKQIRPTVFFGIFAYLCFIGLGYLNVQVRLPAWQPNHFSHSLSESASELLEIKIRDILKSNAYNSNYIGEVVSLNGNPSEGKLLLNLRNDSVTPTLSIDDLVLISSRLEPIRSPLNPHQFDYSKYMATRSVYYSAKISEYQILKTHTGSRTIKGIASGVRDHILEKLQRTPIATNERAIMQALVLGQKKDIDTAMYEAYAAAGAVHILAVSGLHVGILFLFFSALFSPLNRLPRGQLLQSVFVVLSLFGFAILAGWSPSVVRATVMFSLFALANILHRRTNTFNTLFLSFFLLLIIHPQWLFQVGFQLSYLAVFFILLIQPKLGALIRPRNYLFKKLWDIVSVSIAAQIGVLPLSLYYFHQFPGLFLLTNIVVLPFLGILLIGGILVVLLSLLNILPEPLALVYNFLVETLNRFVQWVADQDAFLFDTISFSEGMVVGTYLLILSLIWFIQKPKTNRSVIAISAVTICFSILLYDKYRFSRNEFIVFHKNRETVLGYKHGRSLTIFKSDTVTSRDTRPVQDYLIAKHIETYSEDAIPSVFKLNEKYYLVLDSIGVYPSLKHIEGVILRQSPKVNLDRLIDSLQPSIIIADGSNYRSYVSRWQETCKKRKLPFHHTGTQGAFSID